MALLSVMEAAAIANLSRSRIQKAIAAGQIRAVRLEGMWLLDSDSLAEWIAKPRPPGRPRKAKPDEPPKKRRKRRKPDTAAETEGSNT